MVTRRVIKGVLGNFLGTYVSRYSAFDGYWLFGFPVGKLGELRINLLGQSGSDPDSPRNVAILSAAAKFAVQRQRTGLAAALVREAWLTIQQLPGLEWGSVNGHSCAGFNMRFVAEATMDDGKRYQREQVNFVAPHDPAIEMRSA